MNLEQFLGFAVIGGFLVSVFWFGSRIEPQASGCCSAPLATERGDEEGSQPMSSGCCSGGSCSSMKEEEELDESNNQVLA